MNYYDEIKCRLIKSEIYDRINTYKNDTNKVDSYYEIGRLLFNAGKEYGKNIIHEYSEKLSFELGKTFKDRLLFRIRQFYITFSNEKLSALRTQLSWTHYKELISLKNIDEIKYYIYICIDANLSTRDLSERIRNNEYDRLKETAKYKIKENEELTITDLIPNPILIKADICNDITEYALKQLILNNIDEFLAQLGSGFSYVGNEYKIKVGNTYNYIDILLFNMKFNCYVVVELKTCELKKEHIGQIQIYMNYVDKNIKENINNKTIGIIICRKYNAYVIEYSSDDRITSREYRII